MNPKITCPHCNEEFQMEEGLSIHLKKIEEKKTQEIEKKQEEKMKSLESSNREKQEKLKSLEDANKEKDEKLKLANEQKEKELKAFDKQNKEHYKSLFDEKFKSEIENRDQQNAEKEKLWKLKEERLILTIEDLTKKAKQGTTVDQGSSSEMQLGEYLKDLFKDKKDKINEYEKGVAGGDWLQEVVENDFTIAKILYERKNTKAWSNGWIKKLQDDMKDSKSDVGIIFTKALPKEFPKNKLWDHKGNIFICKYNFIALNALSSMQRWYLAEKNKQDELGTSNVLSATKWIESPIITNILMQKINISEQKNQKFKLLKKNLEDVEKLDESSDNIFEELLDEINKVGVAAFIEKWKKKKNKK